MNRSAVTLRSRQLNPCDVLFWRSRGYFTRPENWQDELYNIGYYKEDDDDDNFEEESGYEEYEEEDDEYEDEDYEEDYNEYEDEDYEEDYDEYEDEDYEEDYDEEEYDSNYEELREYSNANNPNNDAFWQRRGYSCRPANWKELRAQYGF